jgi:hypothetical protein
MAKWLKAIIGVVLIIGLLFRPTIAFGLDKAHVFINFTPLWSSGIYDFKITYVNEQQMDLTWQTGIDISNTMVRAKYGKYPGNIADENETPTDGYLVYYGGGHAASDTSMDFDNNPGALFYRAWAEESDGTWVVDAAGGSKESQIMITIAFAMIACGFSIAGFWLKRTALLIGGVMVWFVFGAWAYNQSISTWDVYYGLFWACMAIALALLVDSVWLLVQEQHKKDNENEVMERQEKKEAAVEAKSEVMMHPIDRIRAKHGFAPSEARARRSENRRLGWR